MKANKKDNKSSRKSTSPLISGTAADFNHIQHVFAVMSGKGGVGKSFVTGLLATALARKGYQVGLLDADITGPCIPMLFGLNSQVEQGILGLLPLQSSTGIKVMSMNLLLSQKDQPVIWRGPMISKAITQLWGDVMWGNLDYLFIDLPPGTSDAALTIMQSLPLDGIIMVTTPQSLSSLIVRKAVHMAQHIKVPIIGIIENMSYYICPDTKKRYEIFGESHVNEIAKTAKAPLLATLPIDPKFSILCNQGEIEKIQLKEIDKIVQKLAKKPSNQLGENSSSMNLDDNW